jgi:hypothetical protein
MGEKKLAAKLYIDWFVFSDPKISMSNCNDIASPKRNSEPAAASPGEHDRRSAFQEQLLRLAMTVDEKARGFRHGNGAPASHRVSIPTPKNIEFLCTKRRVLYAAGSFAYPM